MKNGSRIPKSIIEKYKDTTCFMVNKDEYMMEIVQPRIIWIMPMGYEVEEATLDAYVQQILQAPVDEKKEKFGTAQEKGLKVHQEQVAPNIRKKITKLAAETLISEGHERADDERKTETSKHQEASSTELASPKPIDSAKRKKKATRQYMTVSYEETKSDEDIKEVPKKKGVFARVVREKKEEKKKEPIKETPQKPKITIVHKHKPKSDE
ncbi:FK506-binding protein 4-like [Cryptomeria japonica]|uniref:FK506-binding protein 4-like n=1 Tax=Cryptomeria japonica TaxID=3369 RepID=UPI0027DA979B|nr:FK506-binding protein 4-like [Cryptomeria japonica]